MASVASMSLKALIWTHLYTVSLWKIHTNFHIIDFYSKSRQ